MKSQVSTPVVIGVLAVVLVVLGAFFYVKTAHPYPGGDAPPIPMKVDLNAAPQQMTLPGGTNPGSAPQGGGGATPSAAGK